MSAIKVAAFERTDRLSGGQKRKNAPEREHIVRLSSFHLNEVDEVELDCQMTIRPPKWLYQTKKK
jgi:hypothetical protein